MFSPSARISQRTGVSFTACLALGAALLAVPAGASAAKPISGELSEAGVAVIAVADNGKASIDRASRGAFKLKAPAKSVTLHLRARDGSYAGPIVVGRAKGGKRAIVGVRAGAELGAVKVKAAGGYAMPARDLPTRSIDMERTASAKDGVPIGAGRFGRVRVRKPKGPRSDPDRDGVPNTFDVDDNGNLVFDNLDPDSVDSRSAAAARGADTPAESFFSHLNLPLGIEFTANANAGSTDQQINDALAPNAWIALQMVADDVELDCGGGPDPGSPTGWSGGLRYCTPGGKGTVFSGELAGQPFPGCCDSDRDGWGTMVNNINNPVFGRNMFLDPGATAAEIGTGNVLTQRPANAPEQAFITTLQYAPATVPALVSYSDGQGNSHNVSYPVAGPSGLGTMQNPFPVRADANGQVTVSLTFWRPQRRPLPEEPGFGANPIAWKDVGGLIYEIGIEFMGSLCPQSAYSGQDGNLRPAQPETGIPGLKDGASDAPANPGNTMTFSLNLTQCMESPVTTAPSGLQPAPPFPFNPGDVRAVGFQAYSVAYSNGVSAAQGTYFRRVG